MHEVCLTFSQEEMESGGAGRLLRAPRWNPPAQEPLPGYERRHEGLQGRLRTQQPLCLLWAEQQVGCGYLTPSYLTLL